MSQPHEKHWCEVTRSAPCRICGKFDWCSRSIDGVWTVCRRLDSGAGKHKVDQAGVDYWVYRLAGQERVQPRDIPPLSPDDDHERAGPEDLDAIYRALLELLPLASRHRDALQHRGLTDGEIRRRLYRPLSTRGRAGLVRQLLERFGAQMCAKVPGLYVKRGNGRQWWTLAGPPGLLIPAHDVQGRIVALLVRRDDPGEGARYVWVSSARYGGPGSGAPVHVPMHEGNTTTARVTEGLLKADVATSLSGVLTIGMPGVSAARAVVPVLHALGTAVVRIALDADARDNRHVALSLERAAAVYQAEGLTVELERWDGADGKGIDDLLAVGKEPELLRGEAARIAILGIVAAAREAQPTPQEKALADALERARHAVGRVREDPGAVFEEDAVCALAVVKVDDPAEWARLRRKLQAAGVSLRDLRKALERFTPHLRRRGAQVRGPYLPAGPEAEKVGVDNFLGAGHPVRELQAMAQDAEGAPKTLPSLVREQLPDAPVTSEARVPVPYRLKPDGLFQLVLKEDKETGEAYEEEKLITPAPIVVTNRCQDVDTSEYDLELAWRIQGGWQRATLRRDIAADHRKLPSMALNGLPITSLNAKGVTAYLAKYEHLNLDTIPKTLVTRRCGWREIDGKEGFVLGSRVIGVDAVRALQAGGSSGDLMGEDALRLLADNAGTAGMVAALHAKGTMEGWSAAIRLAAPYPRVLLGIYAALTPPLLYVLGAPNFILDYCGDTSIGKSITQHGAASVWGFPPGARGGLVVAWNSTQVFAERYAELLNDLPILLEDSQTADPRALARTIYMLANEVGRGRGSPRGLRGVSRWRGATISSGERPLHEVTQDGGARARIITLWGSPFGSGDHGPLVRQFKAGVAEHYGHAGRAFVTWLLAHRGQWEGFRAAYDTLTDALAHDFPGPVGDRYASYFAAMLIAGTLATPVLGLPGDPEAAVKTIMRELAEPQEESDTAHRALVDLIGWATGSRGLFEGKVENPDHPPYTYLGRWEDGQYIAIFPHQVRAQLTRMHYSSEAVFRSWRERGWLKVQGDRYTYRLRVRGLPQHMIVLEWAAVESAGLPAAATVL